MLERALAAPHVSREAYAAREPAVRVGLINAQFDLRTSDAPVLLLLAGDDRIGVTEAVQLLHEWLDARHLDTHIFDQPTPEEREHPDYWRYWNALPARGRIGIFVGGWPIDVIGARAAERLETPGFERALQQAREFERTLAAEGTLLLKFWVHTEAAERARRLERARREPGRNWRVEPEDWSLHEIFSRLEDDVRHLLSVTDEPWAPWHVLDGRDDRTRDLALVETILTVLRERLDTGRPMQVPAPPLSLLPPRPQRLASVDLKPARQGVDYGARLDAAQARLAELSRRAREVGQATVLVFEGWDAAGKGGSIRRITKALSVRDYRVVPIAAPDESERAHHWLWRYWRQLPRAGTMLILDRSWYGRVLVERVEGYADTAAWHRAYAEIRAFEMQLVERGHVLLKFWLHIDPAEQLARFQARESTPYKKYKITDDDYRNRARWDDYVTAAEEMFARTDIPQAPWHIVAMNDKKAGRINILESICAALAARLYDQGVKT